MRWKTLSMVAFGIAVAIGCWWLVGGAQFYTKTAQQVVVADELFHTEGIRWEEGLWIGLDIAGPGVLILLVVGALAWRRSRKIANRPDEGDPLSTRDGAQEGG